MDYYVTPGGSDGREVTVWEVLDNRVGVGPDSVPLLTVNVADARHLANEILRIAAEVAV